MLNDVRRELYAQKSNAITLRRAFGHPLSSAKPKEKMAYLEVTNGIQNLDSISQINWWTVTLLSKQLEMQSSVKMEDYLHSLYHNPNTTDSVKTRISKLLEKKTTQKLLQEMSWFVKYANQQEVKINEWQLYQDLLLWNSRSFRWARKIVRKTED